MSGSPFRLSSHQMAKAVAATARQIARTSVTRSELAEPLAQQLKQLRRRTAHRRGCGAGLSCLDQHERGVSRRSKIRSRTFRPS